MKLRILDILKEKGKTKYWLYIQLGLSYQNFNKMVNNQTNGIKFENLAALCEILECTPNDLFEEYHKYEGNGFWWLRDEVGEGSLLEGNACVASVCDRGEIGWSFSDSKKTCIRPAIWVSIDYWKQQR